MTQPDTVNSASGLSANDNAATMSRGKHGKKPTSDKRRKPESYSPEIEALTRKIKKILGQELEARVEIGLDLLKAKDLLMHGKFRPWIRREFRWSERTATNYMKLAHHYEGKTAKFANLDLGTALALVTDATLEKVRDEVFEHARLGGKITREDVRKQIAEVKAAEPKRQSKSKTTSTSDEKKIDCETPSEGVMTEGEISATTIKEPAAEVAEALLNLFDAAEKHRVRCTAAEVAVWLMAEENKRVPLANKECFGFVASVTEALLRMPESQLKLVG